MLKYKLTKVIEDKLFEKYEFTYKFFTSDDDGAVYVVIFNNKTHTRMLTVKIRDLEYVITNIKHVVDDALNTINYLSFKYNNL